MTALTQEQSARISMVLGQKVTAPCPLCGQRAWGWGPDLVVVSTPRHDVRYPLLVLLCSNCGNTMLLNVYMIGIADIWPNFIHRPTHLSTVPRQLGAED